MRYIATFLLVALAFTVNAAPFATQTEVFAKPSYLIMTGNGTITDAQDAKLKQLHKEDSLFGFNPTLEHCFYNMAGEATNHGKCRSAFFNNVNEYLPDTFANHIQNTLISNFNNHTPVGTRLRKPEDVIEHIEYYNSDFQVADVCGHHTSVACTVKISETEYLVALPMTDKNRGNQFLTHELEWHVYRDAYHP